MRVGDCETSETHRKSEARKGCCCRSGVLGQIKGWAGQAAGQGTALPLLG